MQNNFQQSQFFSGRITTRKAALKVLSFLAIYPKDFFFRFHEAFVAFCLIFSLSKVQAGKCRYYYSSRPLPEYCCELSGAFVISAEFDFNIEGGFDDENITYVNVIHSTINFLPSVLFDKFTKLQTVYSPYVNLQSI